MADKSGAAFPLTESNPDGSNYWTEPGLTKLEWFAGQALAGILGNSMGKDVQLDGEKTAVAAFALARFMIRESRK